MVAQPANTPGTPSNWIETSQITSLLWWPHVRDHEFSGADGLAKIPNKGDIAGFDRALHWQSSSLSALTPRARYPLQREMHQEKGLVGGLNGVADNRQGPFCLTSSLSSVGTDNMADGALIECRTDSQGRRSQTPTAHTVPMSWNSHSQSPRTVTRRDNESCTGYSAGMGHLASLTRPLAQLYFQFHVKSRLTRRTNKRGGGAN